MGKSVFFLVYCSVIITAGNALDCYKCEGTTIDDCKLGSAKLEKTHCNLELPGHYPFCTQKIVIDNKDKKEKVLTDCEYILPLGSAAKRNPDDPQPLVLLDKNVQECQSDSNYEVKFCDVCSNNYCNYFNSAPVTKNKFVVFCLPILFFLAKFTMY